MQKREVAELAGEPEVVENGALRLAIRFPYRYRHSTFMQDMVFYADSRRVDFETTASWHESHRLLKAAFPLDIRATKATYDIQYGHVERPTHFNTSWDYARFEVVAHKWADLSESDYGVSLMNNCKYGHSVHQNVMRLTLLKSGKYPDTEADMGEHRFTYALLPHVGTAALGDTIQEAVKLNQPVRTLRGMACGMKPTFSFGSRSIIIDAFKKAEDDDCLIVRFHECRGTHASVELTPSFTMKAYVQCNLLEEAQGDPIVSDVLRARLHPFEIQTYRLWFG